MSQRRRRRLACGMLVIGISSLVLGLTMSPERAAPTSLSAALTGARIQMRASVSGGYWLVTAKGQVYHYGSAKNYGSIPASTTLHAPIVGIVATPNGKGYWLIGGDGGVFSFHAPFFGAD